MPTLTCVTCSVMFATVDLQKQHYKSDWHQYNLKRKVASLDPIPVDQFEHLCALMKKENNDADRIYCNVCKKSFRSKQTFENHLQSKKHVDLLQCSTGNEDQVNVGVPSNKTTKVISKEPEIETDSEIEEVSSDEWDEVVSYNNPALKNNCLFCQHHSASLTKSIKHMSVTHSFFIPDVEYVADLKGLLLYLGEKICQGFMCIWCNDKKSGFISMEAAQSHMRDKGHTKMLYNSETMQEYLEFYYFDEDDINLLNKSPSDLNQTNDENEEECMMVLPSGQTIGHRSLASFYRQHHRSAPVIARSKKLQKVMNYYRSIGWTSNSKECTERTLRDTKYASHKHTKNSTQLSVKSNKLQKHFRPQVEF